MVSNNLISDNAVKGKEKIKMNNFVSLRERTIYDDK